MVGIKNNEVLLTIIEIVAAILFVGVGLVNGTGNYSNSKEKGLYLSLNGGVAKNSNSSWEVAHGGAIGYFITPNLDIGLEVITTKRVEEVLATSWTYSSTPILLKLDLQSTVVIPGAHIGIRVGTSSRKQYTEAITNNPYLAQSFTYGVSTGYEYTFSRGISIGIKALYLHLNQTDKTFEEGGINTSVVFKQEDYLMALTEFKYIF